VSVAWSEDRSVIEAVTDESTPVVSLAVLAVNGVGLLAALLTASAPWALVLLVPVLLAPLHLARASAQANRERARTAALFEAASAAQAARTREDLLAAVTLAAQRLTGAPAARLVASAPRAGQLGARVRPEPDPLWLVVAPRPASNRYDEADASALRVLAALAGQALDRVDLLQDMRRAADSDPLTGLANRRELERVLSEAVALAEDSPGRPGGPGLVYLDLDDFKRVNDTHGHAVGDELLVAVAQRLAAAVREQDLVARYGGDEFVVLLHDTDAEHAQTMAERVRAGVEGVVSLAGTGAGLRVRASAGIALHRPGTTGPAMLAAADVAMYAAKHSGLVPPQR